MRDLFTPASLSSRDSRVENLGSNTKSEDSNSRMIYLVCWENMWLVRFLAAGNLLGKSCEISNLLPHRNTISSMVDDLYSVHRKQLVDVCASIRSFAITVDFWTESYTGIGYGGITLHCVHPQEGLTTFVQCCQLYDMPSSSASNIRLWTEQCVHGFGLQLENQYVVSDNENKMCAAFERNVIRIRCSTHMLNKVIEHGLSSKSGMLFLSTTFSSLRLSVYRQRV